MLKIFSLTAILEGISYLLLFGVGMPLKYLAQIPEPNIYIGYAHGFLFMAYVVLAIVVCIEKKWDLKMFTILFIASLVPFGTFYIDKKYLRPQMDLNSGQ
jgi:integral membrane protein